MTVICLPLLPSNGRLLCLLCVIVSAVSSVQCSAHALLGATLNVLFLVRPDLLGRCSKHTILSLSEREEEEVHCSDQSVHLH
jgi:hypothetical protein